MSRAPTRSGLTTDGVLVALAVVLSAAILWRAAAPARAGEGMVAVSGAHAMLSTHTGPMKGFPGSGVAVVLDQRAESLLVYSQREPTGIHLVGRHNLPELFRAARAQAENR